MKRCATAGEDDWDPSPLWMLNVYRRLFGLILAAACVAVAFNSIATGTGAWAATYQKVGLVSYALLLVAIVITDSRRLHIAAVPFALFIVGFGRTSEFWKLALDNDRLWGTVLSTISWAAGAFLFHFSGSVRTRGE